MQTKIYLYKYDTLIYNARAQDTGTRKNIPPPPKNRHPPKIWEHLSHESTPMVSPLPIGKPRNRFFLASFS